MGRVLFASAWVLVTTGAASFLALSLQSSSPLFLPGPSTPGHHQIERRCQLCHDVGGGRVRQEACLGCHEEELVEADDSHPLAKFLDPRNAGLLAAVDARRCVSCHVEHRPSITGPMGVSRPDGFCAACHRDIATERPSHRRFSFASCADAGCHNYHDNRALRESFLADHLDEPDIAARPVVPALDRPARGARPLTRADQDAPAGVAPSATALTEWEATRHAAAGVNCTGCHGGRSPGAASEPSARGPAPVRWTARPGTDACRRCHAGEAAGFLRGKHGMREAQGLTRMRPAEARLSMRALARDRELSCASCHAAHAFDRKRAAVDACLECHDDGHSRAYLESPHHERWKLEQSVGGREGTGVSCATCHLPRVREVNTDRPGIAVEHDQNAALRPIETMVRPVCQSCHGVAFTLAALADRDLVERNFQGAPVAPARSLQMVRNKRRAAPPPAPEDKR